MAKRPPDWWFELDENDPQRKYPGLTTVKHELGHCLVLAHAQEFPGEDLYWDSNGITTLRGWRERPAARLWPWDPLMSYGARSAEGLLEADDRIGASLLRPRSGWLAGTGSVAGTLRSNGEPVGYAHVWAVAANGTVGVFSDRDGRFVIEGLSPGSYLFWATPMAQPSAHPRLVASMRGPPHAELRDTWRALPVRVEAGRTSGPVEMIRQSPMEPRSGHEARPGHRRRPGRDQRQQRRRG